MSKKERPLFTRGFKELKEKQQKGIKFIRHCNSCHFYFSEVEGQEECCQNESVLPYDVVMTEDSIFCHYWLSPQNKDIKEKVTKEDNYTNNIRKKLKRL